MKVRLASSVLLTTGVCTASPLPRLPRASAFTCAAGSVSTAKRSVSDSPGAIFAARTVGAGLSASKRAPGPITSTEPFSGVTPSGSITRPETPSSCAPSTLTRSSTSWRAPSGVTFSC